MAETLRATCPKCGTALRIPAEWAGKAVKCKKCGGTVRTSAAAPPAPPPAVAPALPAPAPAPRPVAAAPVAVTPVAVEAVPQGVPVYAAPPAVPESPLQFEASEVTKKYLGRKKKTPWLRYLALLVLVAAVGVGGALYGKPLFEELRGMAGGTPDGVTPVLAPKPPAEPNANFATAAQKFPRRILGISVTKYLYANTLTAGNSRNPDMVSIALRRLAYQWKVPQEPGNDQLYILQDAGKNARPVLKPTIERAVAQFCETSRPQDHVLIYFGGHATAIDGKAYLVPTEGELTDAKTLVPVADLWDALKACPAQQKVVVFDVARMNEQGDAIRPGSDPMTEPLFKLLTAAPAGVQVLTTAGPGANALEFRNAPPDAPEEGGSLFLSTLIYLAANGKVQSGLDAKPGDPLPVAAWFDKAKARMAEVATVAAKPDPAPKLTGAQPGEQVAFDPAADPAARLDFAPPPPGLPPAEVAALTAPIRDLPPYRGKAADETPIEKLVPFPPAVMKATMPDGVTPEEIRKTPEKYPVRYAALASLDLIRREWKSSVEGEQELRTQILTGTNDAFKKTILDEQMTPARISDELETQIRKAEKVRDQLAGEPSKYWRVTYLYALAQLKARLAFMSEYNLALGNIRTDNLPMVDEKKGQAGLTLISTEKMKSKKEVKELAEEAGELFDEVAKDYPGTPWAVEAKRYRAVALGLEWRPFVSGNSRVIE